MCVCVCIYIYIYIYTHTHTHTHTHMRHFIVKQKIGYKCKHIQNTAKLNLIFICPCITNIIPNYNQQDATFLDLFISTDALRISGSSSAHNQEHITVHTASGIVNQYCC